MFDYLIRNGLVVNANASLVADVAVSGERIAAVAQPSSLDPEGAKEVVDATGLLVVPGGIDPHCHTGHLVPTAAAEGLRSADAEQVSRAAVYGGTTTLIDFAIWHPGETLKETVGRRSDDFNASYTDFALHVSFQGDIDLDVLTQVPEIIREGHPSVKVWTTNATPTRPRQMTTMGYVWGLLEAIQEADGILAVHGEDDEIVMYAYERLEQKGDTAIDHMHLAHPPLSEALSFRRVTNLLERVGGAAYMVHVSAGEGVQAIEEARSRGLPVYGETLQHYLCFTADAYARNDGPLYHTYPSLKYEEDVALMWSALDRGVLSTVATDEMCTSRSVKLRGHTIGDATGGHVGVEVRLPIVYTEAVSKRGFTLEQFVAMTSTNAARILGLYPKKGIIAPGSDADIVLLDPNGGRTISADALHESDYTIWDGWPVDVWPKTTFVRGTPVVREGVLGAKRGWGQLVPRKIDPSLLKSPR